MANIARACLQSFLKAVNLVMGMVGIAMILYGLWMIRVWQRDKDDSSPDDFKSFALWFIYTFLGIGVSFCLIAGLGHVAADSANGFCLSCVSFLNNFKQKLYIKPFFISVETLKWIFEIFVDLERTKYVVVIFLLLLLESAMVADILLNSDWEKDLPDDPTGRFHDFKEFVKSNFDIFKWIGIWVILTQGSSTLLAMALRVLRSNQGSNYDSDDEYPPHRLPLLNHQVQPPAFVIGDPCFPEKNNPVKPPTYPWNAIK